MIAEPSSLYFPFHSDMQKMNETVYYDNAVTVISKDYFKTSPDKVKCEQFWATLGSSADFTGYEKLIT